MNTYFEAKVLHALNVFKDGYCKLKWKLEIR